MLVELAGIPGSGKTTLFRYLRKEMERRGVANSDINTVADRELNQRNVPRFVRNKPQRAPLFRFGRFCRKHSDLVAVAPEIFGDENIKLFLYFLLASNYQAAIDLGEEGEIILMDEGFLASGVAACFQRKSISVLQTLIGGSPEVDAIIFLDTPAEVAFERAVNRAGGTKEIREMVVAKFGDLSAFKRRRAIMKRGIELYRPKCGNVIEVDTSQGIVQTAEYVVEQLVPSPQFLKFGT